MKPLILAAALTAVLTNAAPAQTYIATEVGKPCPPNSTPVKLLDGQRLAWPWKPAVDLGPWVCAVTSSLTPLENPMPKDSK